MAQLMGDLGGAAGEGMGDDDDSAELQKLLAGLMKGDLAGGFGGAPGLGAGGEGGGEEGEMAALLAALSGGGSGAGAFAPPQPAGVAATSGATAARTKVAASASGSSPAPPPANFQDAIKASMSKMKQSSGDAQAATDAESAAGSDPLAAMLAQMGGMPGGGMGEEGLQGMLDEMMESLMSRELLYQPLKELLEKVIPAPASHRPVPITVADPTPRPGSIPSTSPTTSPPCLPPTLPGSRSRRELSRRLWPSLTSRGLTRRKASPLRRRSGARRGGSKSLTLWQR